jgi:voltage-gated potassium channel
MPLLVLSVVMIPVIIVPIVNDHLPSRVQAAFLTVDYLIWTIFALEYIIKITLAPRRLHYFTHNLTDLVVVAVPMLRPLRILRSARALRLARLTRLSAFAGEGATKAKRSAHAEGVRYVAIITSALIIVTSLVVYDLERTARGATIHTWPDGLWWAIATVTTVGYGDKVPVTAGGRAIATVLMLSGIALVGVITAALATYFVKQSQQRSDEQEAASRQTVEAQLAAVLDRLTSIEAALANATGR